MIIVNCAWRQEDIIKIVENIKISDVKVFRYLKKNGIRIFFECNLTDKERACSIIKRAISDSEYGKALLFNVMCNDEFKWIN